MKGKRVCSLIMTAGLMLGVLNGCGQSGTVADAKTDSGQASTQDSNGNNCCYIAGKSEEAGDNPKY